MASATELTVNTWANDELARDGVHWFKFTATQENQYIHFQRGTLTAVYVQLYNNMGATMESETRFTSNSYINKSLIGGSVYYISVRPTDAYGQSTSGTYKIGFNTSTKAPE